MRPPRASALHHPLDYILASPASVRVLRVLVEHGGSLGVSDIARRARLTLPSTRAALRRLLEADVATGTGAGRTMVCALNAAHPLAPALAGLFNAERALAERFFTAIRTAARRIRPAPLAVWLYGSVARGEDSPSSDIDVALVSAERDPGPQADALREEMAAALSDSDQRVAVVAFSQSDLRRLVKERAPIWTEIRRDAAVLFGSDPTAVLERPRRTRKHR